MKTSFLTLLSGALLVAPFAYADHAPMGAPKPFCEDAAVVDVHEYAAGVGLSPLLGVDGSPPCLPSLETDGHFEFALGGGWVMASEGDGVTTGASVCWREAADSAPFAAIAVFDALVASGVEFTVGADAGPYGVPPPPPDEPDCGDFEVDVAIDCVDACTPSFPPGKDGAYYVFIKGAGGQFTHTP